MPAALQSPDSALTLFALAMQSNPSYHQVLGVVCAELARMFPDEGPITASTDMTKDLPLDSAGTMELVFELETKLDVSLSLNELSNITQVHELAGLIVKLRQAQVPRA